MMTRRQFMAAAAGAASMGFTGLVPAAGSATPLEVRLGSDPTANLRALNRAAGRSSAIRIVGSGPVPAVGGWKVPHFCRDVQLDGHIYSQGGDPVIVRSGALGAFVPGVLAPRLGQWVVTLSDDPVGANGKQTRGYLRHSSDSGLPFPRKMTSRVRSAVVTMAPPLRIHGVGKISHRRPELDYFDPLVMFRACTNSAIDGVEVTSGGYSGVVFYMTARCSTSAHIHDLLDDHNATGWRREANPGTVVRNPNGLKHYGYGVDLMGPNRSVKVRGTSSGIHHVRHAVTTQHPSGNQHKGFGSSTNLGVAGETEGLDCSVYVHNCWSTNISPHENGLGFWFHDMVSRSPGRYQNAYGSTDSKENPDHFNLRCPAKLTRVKMVGGKMKSIGVADNPLLAPDLSLRIELDTVSINDVRRGIQCKTSNWQSGPVTVTRAETGLFVQGGTYRGTPAFVDCGSDVTVSSGAHLP